jgi:AraC-like DNA-binding protein
MNFEYYVELNKDNEWSMDKHHFHENYEILFSLSDAGSLFADGNLYPLNRGTLIILRNTVLHKTIADNCDLYERYVVHFSKEELVDMSTRKTNFFSLIGNSNQCIQLEKDEVNKLTAYLEKCIMPDCEEFGCDLRRDIAFLELLLNICGFVDNKENIDASDNPGFNKMAPILEYIQTHLDEEINLDILSETFYMSKYHLSRLFKSVTGFTIVNYIINCRVLKSREFLRNGYNVQSAGELSGFNNNAHFIRTFGKITGISPGKYMKKYR